MGNGIETDEQEIARLKIEITKKNEVIKALKEIIVDSINK